MSFLNSNFFVTVNPHRYVSIYFLRLSSLFKAQLPTQKELYRLLSLSGLIWRTRTGFGNRSSPLAISIFTARQNRTIWGPISELVSVHILGKLTGRTICKCDLTRSPRTDIFWYGKGDWNSETIGVVVERTTRNFSSRNPKTNSLVLGIH